MILALTLLLADPLALGARAPLADTPLKSAADGKTVTIASVAGKKGTLVVFTCNHCPFAKAWEERIVTLGNRAGKEGVGAILINSNDPTQHAEDGLAGSAERVKARGMQFPYALDETSNVARAFGAAKTPEAFLFDKDGKLVFHGAVDDNHADAGKVTQRYLQDALDAVLAGRAVPTADAKGLGCSIKLRPVAAK